ncbi:DUF3445 domain-containing protein [Aliiroseovarius sediminis]|uniref:heme-dependent oxidative N-demethylase family protein n=1 Tax=Aliiroseovarius sediminis TaxID=2925839 RepID=UPI001F5AC97F|nr:DUF3445 domain-containing protein [Aliiroseovarius sediminis]MCI2393392.1 DUF3445 domain-containing protein [Aliiroseovarius sediminis]
MVEICQKSLPIHPWADDRLTRLPGLLPMEPGEWLLQDDVYGPQMAHRVALIRDRAEVVHKLSHAARPAADELLETVLDELATIEGFEVATAHVICPDGRRVRIDRAAPLLTCGALVQEDLVLMQKQADEHVLTGAILCFPASWSLDEKFMRPLIRIHKPIPSYTDDIARRVQRLFDGIKVGRPMWRANCLTYDDPELHQPCREYQRRSACRDGLTWTRVERQGMRRLPETDAVVFSIHTYVVRNS